MGFGGGIKLFTKNQFYIKSTGTASLYVTLQALFLVIPLNIKIESLTSAKQLDEAHNIKGRLTNTAKAAFELNSEYKWCLSGTPLQNRVGELYSLVRFLGCDPFSYYFCAYAPVPLVSNGPMILRRPIVRVQVSALEVFQ